MTRFVLPGDVPDTRPRARAITVDGRATARAYTASPYRAWQAAARAAIADVWGSRPPLTGPVEVRLLVIRQTPVSIVTLAAEPRRWAVAGGCDVDNAAKAVLDALQASEVKGALCAAGVMLDDAQVVRLVVERVWGSVMEGERMRHAPGATAKEKYAAVRAAAYARCERSACVVNVFPVEHQWGAAGGDL
jgi:Holliday junction resolvase RusA-like endonuclease